MALSDSLEREREAESGSLSNVYYPLEQSSAARKGTPGKGSCRGGHFGRHCCGEERVMKALPLPTTKGTLNGLVSSEC